MPLGLGKLKGAYRNLPWATVGYRGLPRGYRGATAGWLLVSGFWFLVLVCFELGGGADSMLRKQME